MADGGPVVDLNLGPQGGASAASPLTNPLGIMETYARIGVQAAEQQNLRNQNQLFQQTFAARQKAGAMLSMAPSLEEGISAMLKDPSTAGFAPDIISTLQGVQQSQIATRGADLNQRDTSLGMGVKLLTQLVADPSKAGEVRRQIDTLLPSDLRKEMGPTFDALISSVTHGLDPNNPNDRATIQKNAAGVILGFGGDPKTVTAAGGAIPPTLTTLPGGGQGIIGGFAPRSPLIPTSPGTPQGGAGATPPTAGDGKPLFAPSEALPKTYIGNASGTAAYPSEAYGVGVKNLMDTWNKDQQSYSDVARSNATLGSMLQEFKDAARGGGFLSPGFAAAARTKMANALNTFSEAVNPGSPPPFDPAKVAENEASMKNAETLAFQNLSTLFGSSGREGLGTLEHAYASIPNIERTPLGNILIGEWLQAGGQWKLDEQKFKQDWAQRTNGDLTGADAAFLKQHSPDTYLEQVLAKHGMGPEGYKTAAALSSDASQGLLVTDRDHPLENYANIAKTKGWMSEKTYNALKANGFQGGGASQ